MSKEKPTYYAILTADVRYSTKLKANEKLLFAEITALSQKDGTCWASNKYFADLYNVSTVAVSQWISNLVKQGFISRSITYKDGTKEIDKRYLRILCGGIKENFEGGIKQNFKDNTTRVNNINITAAFDEFWSNYPKKVGKKPALSAFKGLSKENQRKAIDDCKTRYVGIIKQFIKNPSTYLNQETWEDERLTDTETTTTFKNVL